MEDDIISALSTTKTRIVVESTEGLQLIANQEHEEHEEAEAGEEEHDHGEYDPHTWISPYMAKLQAEKIYNAIVQADPAHQDYYNQRWQTLSSKLTGLDTEYTEALSDKTKTSIFVSHEAFGYLSTRYGFEQHGVIGLSADEQPSTSTIAALVEEMVEHETYVIYVDPVYSTEYTQTLKTEVEAKTGHTVTVLNLYLMLGPSGNLDYIEQMQSNLSNLEAGLAASQ
jgi:zinc transport system substrate-binding protein